MRISPDPTAAGLQRELTDADRARIDARMARFGVAQEFAEAGMIIGEDYRKVTQLYEQLSAQARDRGEALPAMDVWLQQRAQERLAQGYLPTPPLARPFQVAMSEAASLVDGGRSAGAMGPVGRDAADAPVAAARDPKLAPAAVEGLLGQLALGQQGRTEAVSVDASAALPGAHAGASADRRAAVDTTGIAPLAGHREGGGDTG